MPYYLVQNENIGAQNIHVNPASNSEIIELITPPFRIGINQSEPSKFSYTNAYGEVVFEGWVKDPTSNGYIKVYDIDKDGNIQNQLCYIEESSKNFELYGSRDTLTTAQQAQQNLYNDSIGEGGVDGLLEGNAGYFVGIEELQEFRDASVSWQNADNGSKFYKIASILGILGLPYQYMSHVDPRIDPNDMYSNLSDGTGATYAEKIIANMPLLMITPGKPNFMSGYNTEDKKSALKDLINSWTSNDVSNIDNLTSNTGRFYTFEATAPEFFNYLNPMARICAKLMGLDDKTITINNDRVKLTSANWFTITQNQVNNVIDMASDYMAIPIYIDSDTQIQESFSNGTTDSSLASTVNNVSDMARELGFLLGYAGATTDIDWLAQSGTLSNSQVMEDLANNLINASGHSNFLSSLSKQIGAVATGGKLIFPQIWSDSSFSRSYDVNIKLRSPDMDNFSLYLNIILPLCFLICLTQPRMLDNNPNAYASPFLVRASYKGFFNVDMGIISSLSFSKGDDAQWNAMGIPTTVDVSMTITDLYDTMSITATSATNLSYDTLDNTCLMDYLMTMCGINVYKPEIARTIDMWFMTNVENRAKDFFSVSLWSNLRQSVSNAILNVYRGGNR